MAVSHPEREPISVMYLSWKDFQGYMDDFRRDIQTKFDEHTAEHRSEKLSSKSFRIAILAVAASSLSALAAGAGLLLTHLH